MNELMPEVPAPSRLARIMISVAAVYQGLLTLILIGLGFLTLHPRCGLGFRYVPWFTLGATAALIGWGVRTRLWWTPTAMLIWHVVAVPLVLTFKIEEAIVPAVWLTNEKGFGAAALFILLYFIAFWVIVVVGLTGMVSLTCVQVQRRHFKRPELPPGEKRRLQFPLWVWIPLIAVVGLEGWRIRHGESNRAEHGSNPSRPAELRAPSARP